MIPQPTSSQHHFVVDYRSKGFYRNVYDTVSDIYRRRRVTGRMQRLMHLIERVLFSGHSPVIIANGHGTVITANALRALSLRNVPLDRVHVYALSPPRLVPQSTSRYHLAHAVNVIHAHDHLFKYIRRFRWWKPRMMFDRIDSFTIRDKSFNVLVTTRPVHCANVHLCLDLLRVVMYPDILPAFERALAFLK